MYNMDCWNLQLKVTETSTTGRKESAPALRELSLPPLLPLPSLRMGLGVNLIRELHDPALLCLGPERQRHGKERSHLEPPRLLRLPPLLFLLLLLLERGVEEVLHRAGVHCVSRSVRQQRCAEERPRAAT